MLAVTRSTSPGTPEFGIFTVAAGAQVTISGLTITGGYLTGAAQDGGGILNSGTLAVTGCTISDNWGSGIANFGTLTVANSTFNDNRGWDGGGIDNESPTLALEPSTLAVSDCTFRGNWAILGVGGGIANGGGSVARATVTGSTFTLNAAVQGGGAIGNNEVMAITNSTMTGNSSQDGGGGIENYGTMTVARSAIDGNSATLYNFGYLTGGGGIQNLNAGVISLTDCSISNNWAGGLGGGIFNSWESYFVPQYDPTVTLADCTISGNWTTGPSPAAGSPNNYWEPVGGGLFNNSSCTMVITGSTISGNSTAEGYSGAGFFNFGIMAITNSTVSGNSARGSFGGGAVNSGALQVTYCTIADNSAGVGSGVGIASGSVAGESPASLLLSNTIVAGNFQTRKARSTDVAGVAEATSTHNLIGNGAGLKGISHGKNGNLIGTAKAPIYPRLRPLANNGGSTWTMALLGVQPGDQCRERRSGSDHRPARGDTAPGARPGHRCLRVPVQQRAQLITWKLASGHFFFLAAPAVALANGPCFFLSGAAAASASRPPSVSAVR